MGCSKTERWLTLALLGLGSGRAQADEAWPAPLYVGVLLVSEGESDPAVMARSLNETASLLVGSGIYRVRTQEDLVERLGSEAGECGEDLGCWQGLLWRAGVDVVVRMSLSFPEEGSGPVCHVGAWTGEGPLVLAEEVILPRGGGAPLEWMAEAFLQEGQLSLEVEEGGALVVDGADWDPAAGPQPVKVGRHQVRVQFGDEAQVKVVPVLSGQTTHLALAPLPDTPGVRGGHRRWGLVAAPALAAGGVVALAAQRDRPGDAAR